MTSRMIRIIQVALLGAFFALGTTACTYYIPCDYRYDHRGCCKGKGDYGYDHYKHDCRGKYHEYHR